MLSMRVETEVTYAMRLERISELPSTKFMFEVPQTSPLNACAINEEVSCFKSSCL